VAIQQAKAMKLQHPALASPETSKSIQRQSRVPDEALLTPDRSFSRAIRSTQGYSR
jgi:hypothetical protein